jgi:hypothetical protein
MTQSTNASFFKGYIILFITISGILLLLNSKIPDILHAYIGEINVFLFLLTLAAHFISSKGLRDKRDFHMFYMLSMAVRLFCCIIFVLIILYSTSSNHVVFVGNFFALYLIYTSFEIYFLLRNLRADSQRDA